MLVDWFTVGAQALNFLILVWLMKRFLYKPILNAIDEREKRIAAELADAAAKEAEAQKEQAAFQLKNEEFDKQRAAMMSQATDEAQAERGRLLDEARKAADALAAKRRDALDFEQRELHQSISLRTQQEVFAISRKVLADLAGTAVEERLCGVFVGRLRQLDGNAKQELGAALKSSSAPAVVRSVMELPVEQRSAIQTALNEIFFSEIQVQFETAPSLIGGIELAANGQKVAWSIGDYLTSMEKAVNELLKEKPKPESEPLAASQ
jgi:F-type H+-transporting ATPase subunit b